MGGGPSIPAPPPPPDPLKAAQANSLFYRSSLETYVEKAPDIAALENALRIKYMPEQRQLERQLSAADQLAQVQTGLQLERQYGPQRTMETLRRQYEYSPEAFALNRGLGSQLTRQFERTYGVSPFASVEPMVAYGGGVAPVNYTGGIAPQIGAPAYTTEIGDVLARNVEAQKKTTEKFRKGEI
jgi:hypothetical protein